MWIILVSADEDSESGSDGDPESEPETPSEDESPQVKKAIKFLKSLNN